MTRSLEPPQIICLCGSTRFSKLFRSAERHLAHLGYITLSVGSFAQSDKRDPLVHQRLCELHHQKIELADTVFVLNKDGYIGIHTAQQITFALSINKPIHYLEIPLSPTFPQASETQIPEQETA